MPQNADITIARGTWVQLTNANVTAATFQNKSKVHTIYVKATVGATAPTDLDGAFSYEPQRGEVNIALADFVPGVAGANRLWAYTFSDTVIVAVSHA